VDDLTSQNIPQGPDWRRLTILFSWYLAGIPTAYMMYDTCAIGAPGTWARGIRVFIEGIVAFGLGGLIYVGIFSFLDWAYGANFECFILFFLTGTWALPVSGTPFPSGTTAVSSGKSVLGSKHPQIWWCSRIRLGAARNASAFVLSMQAHNVLGRGNCTDVLRICSETLLYYHPANIPPNTGRAYIQLSLV
jgi:hypothetical protein